jgi:hypothetical protein
MGKKNLKNKNCKNKVKKLKVTVKERVSLLEEKLDNLEALVDDKMEQLSQRNDAVIRKVKV